MTNKWDPTSNVGTTLKCQILTFKDTTDGHKEYVAQMGYVCYDSSRKAKGFLVIDISDNFKTKAECERWLDKTSKAIEDGEISAEPKRKCERVRDLWW